MTKDNNNGQAKKQTVAKTKAAKANKVATLGLKEFALKLYNEIINSSQGRLTRRQSQVDLISFLAEGMEAGTHEEYRLSIEEAPVGTGKSFCLLLLAYCDWLLNKKNSVISTGTIMLQSQLLEKDLPLFLRCIDRIADNPIWETVPKKGRRVFRGELLKGGENYICPLRKKELADMVKKMDESCIFLSEVSSGGKKCLVYTSSEIDTINAKKSKDYEGQIIFPYINVRSERCSDCQLKFKGCPYLEAKRANAGLIVTNHAVIRKCLNHEEENDGFMEQAEETKKKVKVSGLFGASNIFFDEAHKLMGSSSDLGEEQVASERELLDVMTTPLPAKLKYNDDLLDRIIDIRAEVLGHFKDILSDLSCPPGCDETLQALKNVTAKLVASAEIPNELKDRILESAEKVAALFGKVKEALAKGNVFSKGAGLFVRSEAFYSLDQRLVQKFPQFSFAAFLSGTILSDGKGEFFAAEVGLKKTADVSSVPSPFDYKKQVLFSYATSEDGLINPRQDPEGHMNQFLCFCEDFVLPYIKYNHGGVLILTSSLNMMRHVGKYLKHRLSKDRMNFHSVLMQGDRTKEEISKIMKCNESVALVACTSFREGFDIPGKALNWVIIDKLPYENPSDPSFKERVAKLHSQGLIEDEMKYSRSLMYFNLNQAIGRLIRTETDYGSVTILDPRVEAIMNELKQNVPVFNNERFIFETSEELSEATDALKLKMKEEKMFGQNS